MAAVIFDADQPVAIPPDIAAKAVMAGMVERRHRALNDLARILDLAGLVGEAAIDAEEGRIVGAEVTRPVLLVIVAAERQLELLGGLEQQLRAAAAVVGFLGRLGRRDRADVLVISVVTIEIPRHAQRQFVAGRNVDEGKGLDVAIIADARTDLPGELAKLGLIRLDIDRPGGRISPAQRALRAVVHFNVLDVEECRPEARGARDVDAIEMGRGGGIAELGLVVGADAADVDFDLVVDVRHRHAGQAVVELIEAGDPDLFQVLPAQHRRGSGIFLVRLGTAVAGDDDRVSGFGRRGPHHLRLRRRVGIGVDRRGLRDRRTGKDRSAQQTRDSNISAGHHSLPKRSALQAIRPVVRFCTRPEQPVRKRQ